jgi:hypothetical protein
VAEGKWFTDKNVTVAVVVVVVQVGAAEAGGFYCDLDFVVCGIGEFAFFLFDIL